MEKVIIDIIDKKAARQYPKMTEVKRKAYRAMLYAGAQITQNGCTVRDIAAEIGYSESGTSKLVQKWIELMQEGDVTVNLIISAIGKLPAIKRFQHAKKAIQQPTCKPTEAQFIKPKATPAPTPTDKKPLAPIATAPSKPRVKKVLGFIITPEDEMRERAAKRAAILFMQSYGKGRQPRIHGEYYTPGTNPNDRAGDESKWLPLDTAALYCGCKAEVINIAGQEGIIERRVYKRNSNRNYYEYKVADLDRFIRANHLI